MGDPRPASAEKDASRLEEAASQVAAALEEMIRFPEPPTLTWPGTYVSGGMGENAGGWAIALDTLTECPFQLP
jgi:hypothetical protein